ncbi:MAG: Fe-S protein assembly chaperone HscA [Bacteroidetes bacterium]|nr:Fe-S protein assembly chaperone HscA [Bacteroidota bacterium]
MAKIKIDIASGTVTKSAIVVGIDLGTTNSLVAYVNPTNHQPEIIVDEMGSLVPSVIGFQPGQLPQVGYIAKEGLIASPDRTIYSVKRLLGRSYKDVSDVQSFLSYRIIDDETDALVKVMIDDAFYNPIELSAIILKSLKQKAEKALGADVNQAVITVPAYFNDAQRQATRDAGKLAGLDVLRILNEPTAASLSYGLNATEAERVLVYDLGGGTFDVSILTIEEGIFEVLSTKGDTVLGGDDIDRAVMQFWISEHEVLQGLDAGDKQKVRLMAESAKIELSGDPESIYRNNLIVGGVAVDLTLNYSQLQAAANPILQKTQNCIAAALKDAYLKESDIQAVVMVGGSTRYPEIYKLLTALFPHVQVNNQINPDEVVALGAAIEADVLAGNRSDVLLLDVTPLSLGIETAGGLMDVLIPRNSKIPARVGREYTTSIDGQVNMKIAVFQGQREMVAENRKLGEFVLKGIPAMPAGFPKIEVSFAIDANGMLQVRAKELRSNVSQEIDITPQYGLTDAQVEQMLLDGFQFAQSDVQLRMQQEAVNEAQQLIYLAKRFLDKNGGMMSQEEIEGTKQRIEELERLLQSQASKDEILASVTGLNDYTRPFAERLMDVAVASALKGKGI